LYVKIEGSEFILEDIDVDELYLKYEDERLYLYKRDNGFALPFEDLQGFLTKRNEPIYFYDGYENVIQVNQHSKVKFEAETYLKEEKHTYFIFINRDNHLSLVYNKRPPVAYLYNRDARLVHKEMKNNAVELHVEFSSRFFKPISSSCIIKIRGEGRKEKVRAYEIQSEKMNDTAYNTIVKFQIKHKHTKRLIGDEVPYEKYDTKIYDVFFNYQIEEYTLSRGTLRLGFPLDQSDAHEDESWIDFNETHMILHKSYPTMHGNLSFRFIPVPKDTYEYYRSGTYKPLIENNKKTIVCLEYPEKAQENGFLFFKYLVSKYKRKYNIYYLVSRESPDLRNLEPYKEHIVFYKTVENFQLVQQADVICHTHMSGYALPFISNKTDELLQTKDRIFLQHGILGSKNVSNIYGNSEDKKVADKIIVSSDREKNITINDYNFKEEDVIIAGIARFDRVIKERRKWIKKFKNRNKILIMPTWRNGLHTLSEDQFMETDYYKAYQSLITDPALEKIANQKQLIISFYLHRNFQQFTHLFDSDFVHILAQDDYAVNELLADNQILITDYSSVGLDFALMHKKVLYYRPEELAGSDMMEEPENFLPGQIVHNHADLFENLQDYKMDEAYKQNLHLLYKYNDTKACKRIADMMIESFLTD